MSRQDGVSFPGGGSSAPSVIKFERVLYSLLERRVVLYTGEAEGTLPESVVFELLGSLCYVLDIDPSNISEAAVRYEGLVLEEELAQRIAGLENRAGFLEQLWETVCSTMPLFGNIALRDTLSSIEGVWRRYDPRFFPTSISCDVDYPLCHPVSERLQGFDYLTAYLGSLLIEADFLRRFPKDSCERVFMCSCPDWGGLLVNLYEPVAARCIAIALTGHEIGGLEQTRCCRAELCQRIEGPSVSCLRKALAKAARVICEQTGIDDPRSVDYLVRFAVELQPRIMVGGVDGVFPGLSDIRTACL